jgi:hypothetical protein
MCVFVIMNSEISIGKQTFKISKSLRASTDLNSCRIYHKQSQIEFHCSGLFVIVHIQFELKNLRLLKIEYETCITLFIFIINHHINYMKHAPWGPSSKRLSRYLTELINCFQTCPLTVC